MLYILENTDKLGADFLDEALHLLSLQRIRKIDRLRNLSDRISGAAVYLMLRYALKKEYGINDIVVFDFGQHCKPFLSGQSGIHFNLSHCCNSCSCIVSDSETATDISDIRHISLRTAKYFCSSDELDHASVLEDPTDELVRLWTRKECLSKLDGSGLYTDIKTLTKDKMGNICTLRTNNYYCSYYSTTGEQTPRIITVAELFEALK